MRCSVTRRRVRSATVSAGGRQSLTGGSIGCRVRRRIFLPALLLVPACEFLPRDVAPPLAPVPPTHVVFVVDGAGDYRSASTALRETAAADGRPLDVRTFVWSHGFLR